MGYEPLFSSLEPGAQGRTVIEFDGQPLTVLEDVPLAAALLEAGIDHTRRTPVSGAPRTAYCMMGVCFDCLVRIDGVSQRACQVRVRPGLQVHRHVMDGHVMEGRAMEEPGGGAND